jgi:hypothetical protein
MSVIIYQFFMCLFLACMVGVVIGWFWRARHEEPGQYEPDVDWAALKEAYRNDQV